MTQLLYAVDLRPAATPQHREPLAVPTYRSRNAVFGIQGPAYNNNGHGGIVQPSPVRQRLGSIDPNIMPSAGLGGHGLSGGMKVGRQYVGQGQQAMGNVRRNVGASILDMR